MPYELHKAQGYLRQLAAELLYIKTVVFIGGREPGTDPESYAEQLANNFYIMANLHSKLQDIYYVCESTLSWINTGSARHANEVLDMGIQSLPDQWFIPFFAGFNHFRYLNEPTEASAYLRNASLINGAPIWIGHLSAMLAAQGGNIRTGLLWLKAMLATEEDETAKLRYMAAIADFEKATLVLQAIASYEKQHGAPPSSLQELVPEQFDHLPVVRDMFILDYVPPHLYLRRKDARK